MNLSTLNSRYNLAVLLSLFLLPAISIQAQNDSPQLFTKVCSGDQINSGRLIASIEINGQPAVVGEDYVAVFDSDGFVVGTGEVTEVIFSTNCDPTTRGVNFQVNGTNGTVTPDESCPAGYGAEAGEVMTGLIFDGSEGQYYTLPGDLTFRTNSPILPAGDACTPANGTVLPASLTAFRGHAAGPKHVHLDWDVAREENVSHYEVQRSRNGREWERIGEVAATGDSEVAQAYAYDDFSPVGTRQFYRLRMVDLDGAEEFSGIVITELDQSGERTVNTFPNPASSTSRLSIQLGGEWDTNTPISAKLVDMNGRLITDYSTLQAGTTSVTLPTEIKQGLYLLRVTQADVAFTHKISFN